MNNTDIQWSAILSWGYADNILRLKSKQSEPPINFIQSSQQHQVSLGIRTVCQLSSVSWKNEGGQLALALLDVSPEVAVCSTSRCHSPCSSH